MSKLINPIHTLPFIQKIRWVIDSIGYIEKAGLQYPDIFTTNVFSRNSIFVVEPIGIQQLLTDVTWNK
ncbi:MAG TPA: cytochrome P450, partial [Pseudanabaena sp.]|nr:cytochrome P450 [Pseudanabaena sp.]